MIEGLREGTYGEISERMLLILEKIEFTHAPDELDLAKFFRMTARQARFENYRLPKSESSIKVSRLRGSWGKEALLVFSLVTHTSLDWLVFGGRGLLDVTYGFTDENVQQIMDDLRSGGLPSSAMTGKGKEEGGKTTTT